MGKLRQKRTENQSKKGLNDQEYYIQSSDIVKFTGVKTNKGGLDRASCFAPRHS
jgi:hypothetical protein